MVVESGIVAANMFGGIIALVVVVLGGAFLWRVIRSAIRKSEMVDAYFTAKLKQHAAKFNIDLNTEMEETKHYGFWESTPKNRAEAKQRRLNNSYVAQTDLLFEALSDEEKEEKKGKK